MMRTFSQLFTGPIEKDGKLTEEDHLDEASTMLGSSDGASDGADTSLPSDDASDESVEESSPIRSFEWGKEHLVQLLTPELKTSVWKTATATW